MIKSPYQGKLFSQWKKITEKLVEDHPFAPKKITKVILDAWDSILSTSIGGQFVIGKHIFPKPQIMGFFLHELIPLQLEKTAPKKWKRDCSSGEKDIVYIPNSMYSVEIKTSSDKTKVFGNRSFAEGASSGKKAKSGYYLCVNFESFYDEKKVLRTPRIWLIRFGWIDSSDWIGQKASTGQQARLPNEVYEGKLITIFKKD